MARGKLRIYLGAAPGVGKTFAMLNEGRRRVRARHRRRRRLRRDPRPREHRGADRRPRGRAPAPRSSTATRRSRRWTSTRSWPASPQVALVDELAHTNVPGSPQREAVAGRRGAARRGHRRDLDRQHPAPRVDERRRRGDHRHRAAGDDPRRGRAARPTRSSSSTRPRRRSAAAWPTATSTRPRRSTPRSATTSASGNLGALRELALMWVADRVDEALEEYRELHGIAGTWETPRAGRRRDHRRARRRGRAPARGRAWRCARAATCSASTSGRPTASPDRPTSGSTELRRLLAELGGEYHEVERRRRRRGADRRSPGPRTRPSSCSARASARAGPSSSAARSINRVLRVVGPDRRARHLDRARSTDGRPAGAADRRAGRYLSRRRQQVGWLLAVARPAAARRVAARSATRASGCPSVLLLFLLLVVVVAAVGGLLPGDRRRGQRLAARELLLHAAVHTFTIAEGENLLALLVFLVVAGS